MEVKAQVEEYARQRAEEQAILKAARQARQQQEKVANKVTAQEAAKIQERVRYTLPLLTEQQRSKTVQLLLEAIVISKLSFSVV